MDERVELGERFLRLAVWYVVLSALNLALSVFQAIWVIGLIRSLSWDE